MEMTRRHFIKILMGTAGLLLAPGILRPGQANKQITTKAHPARYPGRILQLNRQLSRSQGVWAG